MFLTVRDNLRFVAAADIINTLEQYRDNLASGVCLHLLLI
jgi:hypothetical protein